MWQKAGTAAASHYRFARLLYARTGLRLALVEARDVVPAAEGHGRRVSNEKEHSLLIEWVTTTLMPWLHCITQPTQYALV